MDTYKHHLALLREGLAKALPDRIISKDFINHDQREREELLKGVVTVLLPRIKPGETWSSSVTLMIIGQVEVSQREDSPEAVEDAELKLYHELRRYLKNTSGLPNIELVDVHFSAQREHPFGWVSIDAIYGPIDEADIEGIDNPSEIMPPGVNESELKSGNMDIDIRPHESREEHEKWLKGDYSSSQPEAQIHMEFKHADD